MRNVNERLKSTAMFVILITDPYHDRCIHTSCGNPEVRVDPYHDRCIHISCGNLGLDYILIVIGTFTQTVVIWG